MEQTPHSLGHEIASCLLDMRIDDAFDLMSEDQGEDGFTYFVHGIVHEALGEAEQALICYREMASRKPLSQNEQEIAAQLKSWLINFDPGRTKFIEKATSEELVEASREAEEKGALSYALTLANVLTARNPDEPGAWIWAGNLYRRSERMGEALACYWRSISLKPDQWDVHRTVGQIQKHIGQADTAIASMIKALLHKPDYDQGYLFVGDILERRGQLDEALIWYYKALGEGADYVKLRRHIEKVETFLKGMPVTEAFINARKAWTQKEEETGGETSVLPDALKREWNDIPLLQAVSPKALHMTRIGGGKQNEIYRTRCGKTDLAIRLSTAEKARSQKANRNEVHNLIVASQYGLCSPILYFGEQTGTMIYPFLPGQALERSIMKDREKTLTYMPRILACLHSIPAQFAGNKRPLTERLRSREDKLKGCELNGGDHLKTIQDRISPLIEWMSVQPMVERPIHADCIPVNTVELESTCQLIDWQLSGMGDPFYDVGTFLIESELSNDQVERLIQSYLEEMDTRKTEFWGDVQFPREKSLFYMMLKSYFWCLSFEQKIQDGLNVKNNSKYLQRRLGQVDYLFENELIKQAFKTVGL